MLRVHNQSLFARLLRNQGAAANFIPQQIRLTFPSATAISRLAAAAARLFFLAVVPPCSVRRTARAVTLALFPRPELVIGDTAHLEVACGGAGSTGGSSLRLVAGVPGKMNNFRLGHYTRTGISGRRGERPMACWNFTHCAPSVLGIHIMITKWRG